MTFEHFYDKYGRPKPHRLFISNMGHQPPQAGNLEPMIGGHFITLGKSCQLEEIKKFLLLVNGHTTGLHLPTHIGLTAGQFTLSGNYRRMYKNISTDFLLSFWTFRG